MEYKYNIPKERLTELYLKEKKSMKSISKIIGCSSKTILRRLKKYEIKTRTPWEHKKIKLDANKIKKLYWEENKSINEIANELGVSYTKIREDMIKNNIKRRDNKECSLNKPNLKKTKNLCYILGILKGDGYLYRNKSNYCIALESIDLDFINSFKNALKKINLTSGGPYERKRSERRNKIYKIEARSKIFFKWFKNLNFKKIEKVIKEVNGEIEFIRGVYESEGSYFLTKKRRPILAIGSTNKEVLVFIKRTVEILKLSPTFPKPCPLKSGKPYYKLYFNKEKETKEFIKIINPCIKKKPTRRMK